MARSQSTLPSELTIEEIATTTAKAYNFACGMGELSAENFDFERPGWENAAAWAANLYGSSNDESGDAIPIATLVPRLHAAVMQGMGDIDERFDLLDLTGKLQWEAACRHLFGAITCDPGDNADAAERSWQAWVNTKYEKALQS